MSLPYSDLSLLESLVEVDVCGLPSSINPGCLLTLARAREEPLGACRHHGEDSEVPAKLGL